MLTFMSALVVFLVGVLAAYLANKNDWQDYSGNPLRITVTEFLCAVPILALIVVLVTMVWGPHVAQAQADSGYKQFFNGSVIAANSQQITCTKDGPCAHTYHCDPYTVQVIYYETVPDGVDSKGNPKTRQDRRVRYETHYHDCPYATYEYSYWLEDSLKGSTSIASHIFAANPVQWSGDEAIPGYVERGVPQRWLTSKTRLEAGNAEPVTRIEEYKNYILASQDELLKQYSADIDSYKSAGLLVPHTSGVADGNIMFDYDLQARKIQFVGVTPTDESTWQSLLMQFNAALGSERQGDMHVVVVPASKVSNPDAYINALIAYWQSDEYFGKWGLPKNAVGVVLGVSDDGKTISWARAKTGMPFGNGEMIAAISFDLQNKPFDPQVVLGSVSAQPGIADGGKVKVHFAHGNGILSNIMLQEHPFQRACMDCAGEKTGSFVYLESTIPISPLANFTMLLIVLVLSCGLWAALIIFSLPSTRNLRSSPRKRTNVNKMWW